jgi:hypothetical protein
MSEKYLSANKHHDSSLLGYETMWSHVSDRGTWCLHLDPTYHTVWCNKLRRPQFKFHSRETSNLIQEETLADRLNAMIYLS